MIFFFKKKFCIYFLVEIFRHITTSLASNEQTQGIDGITTAMRQMDVATASNTTIANEALLYSKQMTTQSQQLNLSISKLLAIIKGKNTATAKINHKDIKTSSVRRNKKLTKTTEPKTKLKTNSKVAALENQNEKLGTSEETVSIPGSDDSRFEDII